MYGGRLLRCRQKKYWMSGSPDAYKAVLYSLKKFLDSQNSRNGPANKWELGSVLIFFGHRGTILLEEYDLRAENAS